MIKTLHYFFLPWGMSNSLGLHGQDPGSNPLATTITPRVYTTTHKPDIQITCDSARAEMS
jgi:hypothetical protein